ncbi:MAG: cobalt transport protein [Ruminococcus sp.]|nr:cobalt transport protein [Ruminococcus sp.]
MRSFQEFNPIVIAVYFFSVTGVAMFSSYPPFMAVSLLGGIALYLVRNGRRHARSHFFFLLLFLILAAANPLMSHNGVTVLFIMNDNPITLEALLYGINSAAMIIGVLYWFRSFTQIMTSEKLLYVAGALSPKLSLILSMAIRFVPLFNRQSKRVKDTQTAMGLFRDDNVVDDIRGRMRIFSILVTWGLENGIITADSMAARGYGTGRRSQMKRFRFRRSDTALLLTTFTLLGMTVAGVMAGGLTFSFYPAVKYGTPGIIGICGIAAYSLLALLPVIIETEVSIKWRYLRSRI